MELLEIESVYLQDHPGTVLCYECLHHLARELEPELRSRVSSQHRPLRTAEDLCSNCGQSRQVVSST